MDAHHISRIRNSPQFQELERKRSVFGWSLAILMIAIYASFIGLVAFGRTFMAQQIGDGPLTLAFPIGLGVMLSAILLTAVYVLRANSEFDRLTQEIVGQADRAMPVGAVLVGGVR